VHGRASYYSAASKSPIVRPHDFVVLGPADGCWIASWNGPGETDISIYVDATTEPSIHADVVSAVDLDLDVVQLRDGTVRVLDEDEFAEHQTQLPGGGLAREVHPKRLIRPY
jgi:uncharacterized protein